MCAIVGGVSAAVSKTAAAPIERVKLLIQNQVCLFILQISHGSHPLTYINLDMHMYGL